MAGRSKMSLIIIYSTFSNLKEAKKITSHLIDNKFISCANLFPVESYYRWKGKVENSKEIVSVIKTRKENWGKVKKEIKKLHSYETPCIIKIDAEANSEFTNWVLDETE
jgi:periplasmic divalent cation tolerance protein